MRCAFLLLCAWCIAAPIPASTYSTGFAPRETFMYKSAPRPQWPDIHAFQPHHHHQHHHSHPSHQSFHRSGYFPFQHHGNVHNHHSDFHAPTNNFGGHNHGESPFFSETPFQIDAQQPTPEEEYPDTDEQIYQKPLQLELVPPSAFSINGKPIEFEVQPSRQPANNMGSYPFFTFSNKPPSDNAGQEPVDTFDNNEGEECQYPTNFGLEYPENTYLPQENEGQNSHRGSTGKEEWPESQYPLEGQTQFFEPWAMPGVNNHYPVRAHELSPPTEVEGQAPFEEWQTTFGEGQSPIGMDGQSIEKDDQPIVGVVAWQVPLEKEGQWANEGQMPVEEEGQSPVEMEGQTPFEGQIQMGMEEQMPFEELGQFPVGMEQQMPHNEEGQSPVEMDGQTNSFVGQFPEAMEEQFNLEGQQTVSKEEGQEPVEEEGQSIVEEGQSLMKEEQSQEEFLTLFPSESSTFIQNQMPLTNSNMPKTETTQGPLKEELSNKKRLYTNLNDINKDAKVKKSSEHPKVSQYGDDTIGAPEAFNDDDLEATINEEKGAVLAMGIIGPETPLTEKEQKEVDNAIQELSQLINELEKTIAESNSNPEAPPNKYKYEVVQNEENNAVAKQYGQLGEKAAEGIVEPIFKQVIVGELGNEDGPSSFIPVVAPEREVNLDDLENEIIQDTPALEKEGDKVEADLIKEADILEKEFEHEFSSFLSDYKGNYVADSFHNRQKRSRIQPSEDRTKDIAGFLDELERDIAKGEGKRYSPPSETRPVGTTQTKEKTSFWARFGEKINTGLAQAKEKTKEIYHSVAGKMKQS